MSVPRSASPRKPEPKAGGRPWRRWLLRFVLLGLGLVVGIGVPVFWVLDKQVREEFEQLSWQVPTRVYARPLALVPGERLDAATFELELAAAAYRADGGELPGTYSRDGGRFHVATRAFTDLDGPVPARKLEVVVSGGRIARVTDRASGKRAEGARLDPARIATLYGNAQEERRLVQLKEVPSLLVTGLQAVEDRNFKHHHGIDPWGILRAAWVNAREGELEQGASTLTQQLVRNLFLTREKRWSRKFKEIAYSLIIEARYDKQRILEAYFNEVYLGQHGNQAIHGIAAGAEFWFGRDLSALRTQDMALLVGMIQGPSVYDPRRRPEAALKRRNLVLAVWRDTGLISAAEAETAMASTLGVSARPGVASNRNPAFMDLVRRQLARDYPADALRGAGLVVVTTLSPSAQLRAEQAVTGTLDKVQRKEGPALQAGLVLTDTQNGEVLAMVGNRDTDQPGFNRALEAQRPVGSLLKPFVYLLALAQPDRWTLVQPGPALAGALHLISRQTNRFAPAVSGPPAPDAATPWPPASAHAGCVGSGPVARDRVRSPPQWRRAPRRGRRRWSPRRPDRRRNVRPEARDSGDRCRQGPGSGRETAIRSLQASGLEVGQIQDVTSVPFNGVRSRKRRRV